MQHVTVTSPRVGVLLEGLSGREGDEGLAYDVFVTALHGLGTVTAARPLGDQQVLADERCQGHLVH